MAAKPTVGVALALKLDDRTLAQSEQKARSVADKVAATMSSGFTAGFSSKAQIDPSKLANPAKFAQQGAKVGQQFGTSAADAIRRGDFAGAARDSARTFSMHFEKAATPKATVDTSNMAREGGSAGDSFASGFGSAAGLAKLAGKGGPIAGAIIAGVTAAVKVVGPMVQDAMKIDAAVAMAGARGGLNPKQLAEYRKYATEAWARNSGASIDANVSTAVTAMQSGLGANAQTVESLNAVSAILGEEIPAAARSAGQLIRTGLAANAQEAFDILISGQQNGLNVSQDWLDTIDEYATQFRALGLSGADAIGLLSQMTKAGARNTDVAADSLKELAIRAQDGSKATNDAFNRLGLDAAEMASKISAGGNTARTAFDRILDAIRNTKDPVAQMQTAVALLGTKAEDLGDAFKAIDLSTAANSIKTVEGAAQSAADTALRTSQNEWQQAGRNIEKVWQRIKDAVNMGEWGSDIPRGFNQLFFPDPRATLTPGAPGVPGAIGQGPGPAIAAPPGMSGGGNPLDIFAPRGGNPTAPSAPALPAPGQWWGPNMTPPPVDPRFGSQYTRDGNGGGGSSATSGPVVPFSGDPMSLLHGLPVTASLYSSANGVLEAQHRVQTETAKVQALMADNTATAEAITAARNSLADAERQAQQAELSLIEAKRSATDSFTNSMQSATDSIADIGAALDNDLGLSKGLPGLADNLVRFVANLATAPLQGALARIANPPTAPQSYVPAPQSYGQHYAPPQTSGLPRQYERGMVPNNVAMLRDLEALFPGLTMSADTGRRDKFGEHGSGQALDIMVGQNAAQGDAINKYLLANADRYGLQYNLWRQQQWNPDGTVSGMPDRGSPTQNHMDHVHARVAPGAPSSVAQSGLPAPGSFPGGGGPMAPGMPQGFTPSFTPTTPAEQAAPSWQPQGGGNLGSGFLGMAMGLASGAAGMGANAFAPGSGAAAQAAADMAMKAINRTIAFGGQAAGIGVQGLMETFGVSDPDGGGNSGGASWLTRIAGSLAGIKPAGGQAAGKADKDSRVDPNAQQQPQQQQGPGGVHIGTFVQAENRNSQQVLNDLSSTAYAAQINPGQ